MLFCEFARHLYPIVSGDMNTDEFTQELFRKITQTDNEENIIENTVFSTYRSYYSGERSIKQFAKKIRKNIEPACFMTYIDDLSDEAREQIVQAFSSECNDLTVMNVGEKMADLFKSIIIEASEASSKSQNKAATQQNHTKKKSISEKDPIENEAIFLEAQKFCMMYENEISLLPLCQIAFFIDPLHKNIRQMYSDYILLSSEVKKKVLEMKDVPTLIFSEKWIEKAIAAYEKQVIELGLTSRSFLYEGAKYFHYAYNRYSQIQVNEFNPCIFDRIYLRGMTAGFLKNKKCTISSYIEDYLYYQKTGEEIIYDPPMDYLWDKMNLGNCPEHELSYWICLFIITSCYQIMNKSIYEDEKWENIYIHSNLIQTLEDMYYYALLQLYRTYEL
ncbi:MAG: hypothetical protein K6G69_10285 [Lachnospiraceae bacterium]|nr:hypothetical protein [Lachnospiraceae bacterium]